jgi:uncharacterized protein with GYD domain
MSHYMAQFAYTAETWAALRSNPTDRTAAVSGLAEKLGCRLVGLYYTFGEYDGIMIFEAPDDTAANALMVAALAPGHIKATRTTRLMAPSEVVAALRRSQGADFKAPQR